MLKKLYLRDLILNKRLFLTYGAMMTIFFGAYPLLATEPGILTGFAGLWLGFIAASVVVREHKFRSATITCSLPVTRNKVVLSKYLVTLSLVGVGFVYFVLLTYINPFLKFPRELIIEHERLASGIFMIGIVLALLFPFVIRFGFMGVFILVVVLQLLSVSLLLLTRMRVGASRDLIGAVIDGVGGAFGSMKTTLGQPGYSIFLVGAAVVLIAVSYIASVAFYKRKEL